MAKVKQVKDELEEVIALLEIITILKDVSTNRFFSLLQTKKDYSQFLELFFIFFESLETVDSSSPLIANNHPGTDILVFGSDASFMSQLNSRVCRIAGEEYEKAKEANIFSIGRKCAEKCKEMGMNVEKIYTAGDTVEARAKLAVEIRDTLVQRVMTGKTGKALCIYLWPKSFSIVKPRVVKLLPATDLVGEIAGDSGGKKIAGRQSYIMESKLEVIMRVISNLWVSSRLLEISTDSGLAEAAVQAQQLDSAIDGLSVEKKGLMLQYRRAKRELLNKGMREVFTAASCIK